jgi:hypothetical protein
MPAEASAGSECLGDAGSARSAPTAIKNAAGKLSPSGSASANACSGVNENVPVGASKLTYPPAAWPASHSVTYR